MKSADDATQIRRRQADLADRIASAAGSTQSINPSVVCHTKTLTSYPTAAAAFYGFAPATVTGDEVEGGAVTVTVGDGTIYALNLGTAVPAVGTEVLVTFVDGRWVFRWD